MTNGTLQIGNQNNTVIAETVWADLRFPDFHFIFRDSQSGCQVLENRNGEELLIGQCETKSKGFLGLSKIETLRFVVGDREIGVETNLLANWVHYQGERIPFIMKVESEEVEQPETNPTEEDPEAEGEGEKNAPIKEYRTYSLGESNMEHHDYESHFRINASNEEEGILIAFIAFRFWANQFDSNQ